MAFAIMKQISRNQTNLLTLLIIITQCVRKLCYCHEKTCFLEHMACFDIFNRFKYPTKPHNCVLSVAKGLVSLLFVHHSEI